MAKPLGVTLNDRSPYCHCSWSGSILQLTAGLIGCGVAETPGIRSDEASIAFDLAHAVIAVHERDRGGHVFKMRCSKFKRPDDPRAATLRFDVLSHAYVNVIRTAAM